MMFLVGGSFGEEISFKVGLRGETFKNATKKVRRSLRFSSKERTSLFEATDGCDKRAFFNEDHKNKHFRFNELLRIIKRNHKNISISNASLTNVLKGLCEKGFIREIHASKPYYDIVTNPHIHLYDEEKEELFDVKDCTLNPEEILNKINLPEGYSVKDINIVISIENYKRASKM